MRALCPGADPPALIIEPNRLCRRLAGLPPITGGTRSCRQLSNTSTLALGFRGYRDDLARHNVADAHSAPLQNYRALTRMGRARKNRGIPSEGQIRDSQTVLKCPGH